MSGLKDKEWVAEHVPRLECTVEHVASDALHEYVMIWFFVMSGLRMGLISEHTECFVEHVSCNALHKCVVFWLIVCPACVRPQGKEYFVEHVLL